MEPRSGRFNSYYPDHTQGTLGVSEIPNLASWVRFLGTVPNNLKEVNMPKGNKKQKQKQEQPQERKRTFDTGPTDSTGMVPEAAKKDK